MYERDRKPDYEGLESAYEKLLLLRQTAEGRRWRGRPVEDLSLKKSFLAEGYLSLDTIAIIAFRAGNEGRFAKTVCLARINWTPGNKDLAFIVTCRGQNEIPDKEFSFAQMRENCSKALANGRVGHLLPILPGYSLSQSNILRFKATILGSQNEQGVILWQETGRKHEFPNNHLVLWVLP